MEGSGNDSGIISKCDIYGDVVSLQGLMRHIEQQLVTWKVWILNSQWDVDHNYGRVISWESHFFTPP